MTTHNTYRFVKTLAGWQTDIDGKPYIVRETKVGDVMAHVENLDPDARIGFRASDIGPSTAYACMMAGHGNTLWMKTRAERMGR